MRVYIFLYFIKISIFTSYLNAADEVLIVTGSYLEDKSLDSSPVDIISSEKINNLNLSSIAEIGKFIHTASGSHFQTDSLEGTDQGMANLNLRGLNLSATLVMINSKRNTLAGLPAESGDSYVDINLFPQIAVERIEILKEGATSLYGSDAIAGVVNFFTFTEFQQSKIKFSNQKTQHHGQDNRKFELLHGAKINDINFVLGLEFLNRSSLPSKKIKGISELGISIFGNTYIAKEDGTKANTGPYSGDSYDEGDKIIDPNCVANGGTPYVGYCGFIYGDRFNITNEESHTKAYLNINKSFDTYKISSTFISSNVEVIDNPQSPSYPALSFPVIGVGKAGSPFNKSVIWYGRPLGALTSSPLSPKKIDQFHFSSFIELDLSQDDVINLSFSHSEHENYMSRPDTISSRLTAALNNRGGPNSNLTWDLFDSSQNTKVLKNYISGSEDSKHNSRLSIIDILFQSKIKKTDYVLGFQAGTESLEINWNDLSRVEFDSLGKIIKAADLLFLGGGSNVRAQRDKYSLFSEFYPSLENDFDLKLSVRYEKIGNESSFDPKISLKKSFENNIFIRGSIGTSFAMPSLGQLYSSRTSLNRVDGNFIRVSKKGNTSLKPQASINSNLGLIYLNKDRKISFDYWKIDYKDRLTVESATALYEANPNDPAFTYNGSILYAANIEYINEETTELSGLDISFEFGKYNYSFGEINFKMDSSYLIGYETSQAGSFVERAGRFNYDIEGYSLPEYKINLFAELEKNPNRYFFNARYVSSYENLKSLSSRAKSLGGYSNKVDFSLMYDFGYQYDFKNNNIEYNLSLSILNLTDEDAPKVNSQPEFSYDPRQIDPRGRIFSFGIEIIL